MKNLLHVISLACVSLCGCTTAQSDEAKTPPTKPTPAKTQVKSGVIKGGVVVGDRVKGKVVQTMDASGYTYASVDVGLDAAVWVVGPQTALKVGNALDIPKGSEMKRFRSKTMNKVFEPIYFVADFGSMYPKTKAAPSSSQPSSRPSSQPSSIPLKPRGPRTAEAPTSVPRAPGGHTIAEIFAKANELANKSIVLRARVVKVTSGILGKNWVHLKDGTGDPAARTHDLTVTTDETVTVGQTMLVRGVLVTNKDLGSGYKYPVILEQATFKEE